MKKQITSSVLKSIFTSAILVTVLFIGSANAAEKDAAKASPYELKYVGKFQNQPVFQLNVDNVQGEDIYIRLEDEVGNTLYNDKFNEKSFSKKFQFDMNDGYRTMVKVVLVSKSARRTQLFEINNVEKSIQQIEVTKVD